MHVAGSIVCLHCLDKGDLAQSVRLASRASSFATA
jgi:hypothetical protein